MLDFGMKIRTTGSGSGHEDVHEVLIPRAFSAFWVRDAKSYIQ
jgi:hypothetical protein